MKQIENWNAIEEPTSFEKIELGGHTCVIKGAKIEQTKNGGEMLVIAFDFSHQDKQAGYYAKQFEDDKKYHGRDNAKWRGVYRQMHGTEKSNPFFKQFINNIVKSNQGYIWNWDESTLIGKQFGGVFGREEYLNAKKESKFATKCVYTTSLENVYDAEIPQDKLLETPVSTQFVNNSFNNNDLIDISDNDLPF